MAVIDSTRLDADPHLSRAGLRNIALHDFEVRSCLRYLHRFHFRHLISLLWLSIYSGGFVTAYGLVYVLTWENCRRTWADRSWTTRASPRPGSRPSAPPESRP